MQNTRKDVLTDEKHQKLSNSLIFDSPLKKWSKKQAIIYSKKMTMENARSAPEEVGQLLAKHHG